MSNLLLHSMSNFKEVFEVILKRMQPKILVEIGCEYAGSTFQFLEYCKNNDAFLYIVDPSPFVDVDDVLKEYKGFYSFIKLKSLDALEKLEAADLYIVDGDHNYWTVINELKIIFKNNFPLVILHDVGFPCANRDLYYNPTEIPDNYLHEYSYDYGVDIDNNLVRKGGFYGAGNFAFSLEKDKEKMGVLKAIDDFIGLNENSLVYDSIPLIFGLGFISNQYNLTKIKDIITPYQTDLMSKLEFNRMELYLKVLSLQSELDELRKYKIVRAIERFKK